MRVPKLNGYFPSRDMMDAAQRRFLRTWTDAYRRGDPISVDGQVGYLFVHAYDVISTHSADVIIKELGDMRRAYPGEKKFVDYAGSWLSDAHVLRGDYETAFHTMPAAGLGAKAAMHANRIITLKSWLGRRLEARELVALVGPMVTSFGREHLDLIYEQIDVEIRELELSEGRALIQEWVTNSKTYPLYLFSGTPHLFESGHREHFISGLGRAIDLATTLIRKAENVVREEAGLPHVGAGWIAETKLYHELRAAFPNEKVEHHASPRWLGRQHLDIYFPSRLVAVEYQGRQHDEPVAFFGGEEAYRRTQSRDRVKRKKCEKAGVLLLEVRPDYDFEELVSRIRRRS